MTDAMPMNTHNINTRVNCQVQGYFRMTAVQGDDDGNPIPGTERELCDWTPNLLTNNGMELLKSTGFLATIAVGSGSTAPAKTDTTLEALVASMAATVTVGPNDFAPADYPWCSATATCQFAKGVAAGNLSELSIGKTATNLLARALIKDAGGNPVTITVTSIELLTVTYQWRVYFDLTYTHDDTFTIDGVDYTATTICGAITSGCAKQWNDMGIVWADSRVYSHHAYTGAVNAPGVAPSGAAMAGPQGYNATFGDAGNNYVDLSSLIDENTWNGNITAVVTLGSNSITATTIGPKVAFSPPIPKDNTNQLNITTRMAWARQTP